MASVILHPPVRARTRQHDSILSPASTESIGRQDGPRVDSRGGVIYIIAG